MKHYDIRQGDALELFPLVDSGSVQAVITDPPYMIRTSSASLEKVDDHYVDLMNGASWYAAWFAEAWRVLDNAGYLVTFANWRSMPVYIKALAMIGVKPHSCMVWDKAMPGTGHKRGLRSSYEIILFSGKPDGVIPDRSARDVYQHKWNVANHGKTGHPAEKPVPLVQHLIELVTRPGDLVLDPFCGSGTTGVAALQCGRRFTGFEAQERYVQITHERMMQVGVNAA